jgi:poly-gamma-glutamate synthesis protein (capsule biosynthesis protein)
MNKMSIRKIYVYISTPLIAVIIGVLMYVYTNDFRKEGIIFEKTTEQHYGDSCPKDLHYSYFSTKDFFDKAYKYALDVKIPNEPIKGILVNHHLLAPHLIATTMNTIATDKPVTVVLVSPNHFSSGNGQIISSLYKWDTPYGVLNSDCDTISQLRKEGVVTVDEFPFKKEHGISGIVPFIKKSLPNATIIPILVKDTISENDLNTFIDSLYATLGKDVIVIGSFDFSHYLPDKVAEFHDAQSLSVITHFDYEGLHRMDTDSIPGLEIVMKYMQREEALNFTLIANTNSSKIIKDKTIEETTSYIDGTFSIGNNVSERSATILSFGDMMLDRIVRIKIENNTEAYPFEHIKRFLSGSDIVVANAEGAFTHFPSKTSSKPDSALIFTFDANILKTLSSLHFSLFSEANNHALNFGREGLHESEKLINQSGMSWFGDPSNKDLHSFTTIVRGQRITFIGYHQFANSGLDVVLDEITQAKKSGSFVVVYPHWGEEYKLSVTKTQVDTAHKFIDVGADLVIGSHPHVIEPIEVYKNKAIFYSLGNFIFDQSNTGPTSEGLSVGIVIKENEVIYYLFPIKIRNAQASLMPYVNSDILLNDIALRSDVSNLIKNQIKSGVFSVKK